MATILTNLAKIFSFSSFLHNHTYDNVDPNLVRYYRTEYGADWQSELEFFLYNQSKKGSKQMKKILDWILSLYETEQQVVENYLSKSKDHADLEFRMKELDRSSINGKQYSRLYNRFYI